MSQKLIGGVKVKKLVSHHDDRGFLMEIIREDENILEKFGQATFSLSYPGVIKAFHYHDLQDDAWFFPTGQAQAVLYDLRKNSSTYRQTNVFYPGETNPLIILIPRGVAHGYRVLGNKLMTIVYFTTETYDPQNPDEHRIAYDDPAIGFDWNTQNR